MKSQGFPRHLVAAFWDVLPCLEHHILPQQSVQGMARTLCECQSARDATSALRLHVWLCESGLDAHSTLGNDLVAMLVEAGGSISYANQLFCRLTLRTAVSWTSILTGLVRCGDSHCALALYLDMANTDFADPSGHVVVALLQACAIERNIKCGLTLHAHISKAHLLKGDPFVGSALLNMYIKCGCLEKAQEVFNELPSQDVVSWTMLIGGYVEHGHGKKALKCFEKMQVAGVLPDAATFVCGLKACGCINVPEKISDLHADIERRGLLTSNLFVGSVLTNMYAKCGFLVEAQQVFDKLRVRDVVSWNVLISGYVERGENSAALDIFERMKLGDVVPNDVTFVHALKGCSNLGAILKGQEIYVEVARRGLAERHALVGSALVDMYIKCDSLSRAREVFDNLQCKDSVSWNIMIAGYAEHGSNTNALDCFEKMHFEGLSPDTVTYASILRCCGSTGAAGQGQVIHADIVKKGLLEGDLIIANSLIDMYINFAFFYKAQQVFDGLSVRDVVTWNILISGYVKHGHFKEALNCFAQMHTDCVCPDAITFIYCLKIFTSLETLDKGQELHSEIERLGLVTKDVSVASALVDMYAKCGFFAKAEEVFNSHPDRDMVMWNALITGYTEHDCGEVAFAKFEQMQLAGFSPSHVTVIGILKACARIGAVHKGQEIHAEIVMKGLFDGDLLVGNTLIDMYAKVGSLVTAQQVFENLYVHVKDVSSWNALIGGYSQLGKSDEVFMMFDKMLGEGKMPDPITFAIVLGACSRSCHFEKCHDYIQVMREDFGIVPMLEHQMRLVDSLSRVGELGRAVGIMKKMPFCPNFMMWKSVLSACRNWGSVELGEQAFAEAVSREESAALYESECHKNWGNLEFGEHTLAPAVSKEG